MRAIITLKGIDEAINNLGYTNERHIKTRALRAIRQFYSDENSIRAITDINIDNLIRLIWDKDAPNEIVKNKRKNFNSIKSSINADLTRLHSNGKNSEGIIIGKNNTFDMSDKAKSELLENFSVSGDGDSLIPLGKINDVLGIVNDILKKMKSVSGKDSLDDKDNLDQIKELIQSISQKIGISAEYEAFIKENDELPEQDLPDDVEEIDEGEVFEDADLEDTPEDELEEVDDLETDEIPDEALEEVDDLEDAIKIDEADDVDEVDEPAAEDITDNVEEVEAEDILEDDQLEDIPGDELEEVDDLETDEISDELLEEVDDLEDAMEIDEADDLDEVDEPAAEDIADDVEEVEAEDILEDDQLEDIPGDELEEADDLETDEIPDEALEEVDDLEDAIEIDEADDLDEVDEPAAEEIADNVEEVDEEDVLKDDQLEDIPGDELEEVDDLETDEISDEALEEVDDLEDAMEIDEAGDPDEVDDPDAEEIADDVEEVEAEDVLEDDQLEDIPEDDYEEVDFEVDEIINARILAEEFDNMLSEMDRYYNQQILIPKGKYLIGSKDTHRNDRPAENVFLNAFYIGKFPVTNALFEIFIEKTGYKTTAERLGHGTVYYGRYQNIVDNKTGLKTLNWNSAIETKVIDGACWYQPTGPGSTLHNKRNHPVVQVSIEDAKAFAEWTGKKIPTESQWEAAARTLKGCQFPWGKEYKTGCCNIEDSCIGDTTPVDKYPENENSLGIMDALGNVMEWTVDKYVPSSGKEYDVLYIIKGGSLISINDLTLCDRSFSEPTATSNILGFRCISY